MGKVKVDVTRPTGSTTSWSRTHGSYIAGQACIDEVDVTAAKIQTKWDAGRLRLMVMPELREEFDRHSAIWHGDLEAVRREAQRWSQRGRPSTHRAR